MPHDFISVFGGPDPDPYRSSDAANHDLGLFFPEGFPRNGLRRLVQSQSKDNEASAQEEDGDEISLDAGRAADEKKRRDQFEAAFQLLQTGLDAEEHNKSSRHSLKETPNCFPNHVELFDYQLHAIGLIQHIFDTKEPPSALLAYGMGLGKTNIMHALMQLNRRREKDGQPMLLLVLVQLVPQWCQALQNGTTDPLRFVVYDKSSPSIDGMEDADVVLTTFETLNRNYEARQSTISNLEASVRNRAPPGLLRRDACLYAIKFSHLFVDEAGSLTNAATLKHHAVMLLQCRRRLGATGTPIQNDYNNLQSLCQFLGLEPWADEAFFAQCFLEGEGGRGSKNPVLSGIRRALLAQTVKAHVLRLDSFEPFNGKRSNGVPEPDIKFLVINDIDEHERRIQDSVGHLWDSRRDKDTKKDNEDIIAATSQARQGIVHPLLADPAFIVQRRVKKDEQTSTSLSAIAGIEAQSERLENAMSSQQVRAAIIERLSESEDAWRSTRICYLIQHISLAMQADPKVRILIFDNSTRVLDTVKFGLQKCGFKCGQIDGNVPANERSPLMKRFADLNDEISILLCSLLEFTLSIGVVQRFLPEVGPVARLSDHNFSDNGKITSKRELSTNPGGLDVFCHLALLEEFEDRKAQSQRDQYSV